jgi:starch-binding outer membrane protein, SusD/RagB family
MKNLEKIARRGTGVAMALLPLVVGGCDLKKSLLSPQQPGVIGPTSVTTPTGAEALRVGALGAFKAWVAGGGANFANLPMMADLVTDVWASGDTQSQHNETDQRSAQSANGVLAGAYSSVQQARGFALTAIAALREYVTPPPADKIGELYFAMGFAELQMSEVFCNGIPFGSMVNGVPTYTQPITNADGFRLAIARFDTALAGLTGTSASTVAIRRVNQIAKARAQIALGDYAAAAATVADVPTSYQYLLTFSLTTTAPELYILNGIQPSRFVVGDSFAIINGAPSLIRNALPFASANDPRVPVTGSTSNTLRAFDGSTPWVGQRLYGQTDPFPVLTGIDARLIEIEARINANDFAGAFASLNALRTTPQVIGNKTIAAMAPLTNAPTTKDAALTIFFREKAFWQFGRGQRLGDLRRLIRQYGRTEATTFPEGGFHKAPFTFGNDINLPVPDSEKTNTLFTGCIDRDA